jgi:hypothetical protein
MAAERRFSSTSGSVAAGTAAAAVREREKDAATALKAAATREKMEAPSAVASRCDRTAKRS